ncbi:MAG: hypothetical protein CMN28_02810 [Salinisphaeraceae bacterium]|nr:hypothetical protein [Salinisphaeraceae bacterium]
MQGAFTLRQTRRQPRAQLLGRLILPLLLWAQIACAVPQVHDHIDAGAGITHAETGEHVLVVPDSTHQGEDGSEHELRLHTCGAHVMGLPVAVPQISTPTPAFVTAFAAPHAPAVFHERLLRPPIG